MTDELEIPEGPEEKTGTELLEKETVEEPGPEEEPKQSDLEAFKESSKTPPVKELEKGEAGGEAKPAPVISGQDQSIIQALQEFEDLNDKSSELFRKAMEQKAILQSNGYAGDDIWYQAATMAHGKMAGSRSRESNRESRIESSSAQEKSTRTVREAPEGPRLAPAAKDMLAKWGIDPNDAEAHEAAAVELKAEMDKIKRTRG